MTDKNDGGPAWMTRQTAAWLLVCAVFGVSGYFHGQKDEFNRGWKKGHVTGWDQATRQLTQAVERFGLCEVDRRMSGGERTNDQ